MSALATGSCSAPLPSDALNVEPALQANLLTDEPPIDPSVAVPPLIDAPTELPPLHRVDHAAMPHDNLAAAPSEPEQATMSVASVPSSSLSQAEVREALRLSTIEGAVANVHLAITGAIGGSVFLTGFAVLLGANSLHIGILGALPFIGQLTQFVAAYLEDRFGHRRRLVLAGTLVGRLIWAALLTLPFLALTEDTRLLTFFALLACSYAANGIAGNAWLSWMTDLVPPRRRGSYFGIRNTVATLSAMITTFLAGLTIDHFRLQGREATGYALIFAVAVLAAIGAALLIHRQAEPPVQPKPRMRLTKMFSAPFQERPFRSFVMANVGWALVTGIASPFFFAYGLTVLGISFATLSLTVIVTSAVSLVFNPLIGRLQDTLGSRLVLVGCMIGTVPLPLAWVVATPTNLLPIWLAAIFTGVFWPGLTQGLANVLMECAPAAHRGSAIAGYGAVTGFGTLIAGLLGGSLALWFAQIHLSLGLVTVTGLAFLFVLTSLGRIFMAAVFWRTLASP
ncbi:MFS transporter [Candidatus Chloroploca asiatica]|nr:MFS transporter [Candidatus Chloroploca asiatica]